MKYADLHVHTIFSDGTYSPEQVIVEASILGFSAIAITDHDILDGIELAIAAGDQYGVEVIPGVELSAEYKLPAKGHLDILGLFIDHKNVALNQALDYLRAERAKRSEKILDKLAEIGIRLSLHEVREASDGSAGRPHIAGVLMKRGYVDSVDQAFQKYLKKGAPAFVDKQKLPAVECIKLITEAGGISIIAHPFSLGYSTYDDLGQEILNLKGLGLHGIECYYSNYTDTASRWLREFADKHTMFISGGSDFHGSVKPDIQLGTGPGNLHVPDEVYEELCNFHQKSA